MIVIILIIIIFKVIFYLPENVSLYITILYIIDEKI